MDLNFERNQNVYPLSPMQQGMLFHHLKEPHTGVDVEQLVVHLPEEIDVSRMESAWQWLAKRHDILRARFVWENVAEPVQEFLPVVIVPFAFEDTAHLPKRDQDERIASFLQTDRIRGFELDEAPMQRLTLFKWGPASFSLVWTFHHALLDGRCFSILLREVLETYAELQDGRIRSRPLPPPYQRYIHWLQEQDFTSAEAFWKNLLSGFTAPTPLVIDRQARDGEIVYQQGEAWEIVDTSTTAKLRTLAETNGLTVNSVVMGAWAILLHRYSSENDVLFGATRACRKSSVPDADETIGLFINTVPVRVHLQPQDKVLSVLQTVRRQWVDIRAYEHTPLARVKAVSQMPAAQSLFETLIVFENFRLDNVMKSFGGLWDKRQIELHELTNFPITLAAYDGPELSFKVEFDRRRLCDASIRRLLGHLHNLLKGMAANPGSMLCDLPLTTDEERRDLIEQHKYVPNEVSSRLPSDGGSSLCSLFEAQAQQRPDAIAVTCDGQSLTYHQLNARANRLAHRLVQYGVEPDTLVGICVERSNELVVAILAILKAGGAYLPIDLAYPAERLAFMLDDAQAPVLLTQSHLVRNLPATHARVLCVDEELARPKLPGEETNLPPTAGPDNLAYVIYTSGTTGKPKGSLITHRNAVRLFSNTDHWYGFNDRDVWTLFHSSAFDFSVWEIWGALLYGGRLVVVPFMVTRSPEAFYELLAREEVTVLNQTPSAFRQLIQAEEAVGQQALALRYVIFGGEALEIQSLRPWFDRHGDQKPRLVNMYGITETTVHVTYRPLSKNDLESGSVIGVPIPDLQIYILDAQRHPVPIGVPGEMYVGGAGLARGYLHRQELTAERFIPDQLTGRSESRLYKTGDLARFLPDRDIEYLGRIDDQVKIRGFRIELGEIESVLCQHSAIREATVIAREDLPGTKRLVGYLVSSGPAPEVSALREHLKKKLPEYMVPAAFVFLDHLPLTASGKIDRKALPVPENRPELANSYTAPRTTVEEKLATIWSKALRLQRVGVTDNFFELGGDSILSIQVISLARREGLKLTPKQLFANQTIAELATVAATGLGASLIEEVVSGDVPLTPIQHWFFEQNLEEAQHYNQSFLFEVQDAMDRPLLESALRAVSRQHDALRLRYVREGSRWRQFYSNPEESAPLTWLRITLPGEIEAIAASTQAALNLENGPVWRVVYFDLGSGQPGRLLIVVHHLAVDAVSWRPLLEDLEAACLQLKSGNPVQFPSKTTSFGKWAKRLCEFAGSQSLQSESGYWREASVEGGAANALKPLAHEVSIENTEGKANTLKVFLTGEETLALLRDVPGTYNTQINDVLLTALAKAWNRCTGSRVLYTNMEGHGRENLFEELDSSRTVGWYTSIFPVCLQLPETESVWRPGTALKSIKEQLRQIPGRGIGYGITRYLRKNSGLSALAEPQMLFNYLGQFDQVVSDSKLFRFGTESTGPWHSPRQRRRYLLETNCLVMDGRLVVTWTYNENIHNEAVIRQMADEFLAALKQIIVHCQSADAGGRTPSDFPLAGLDQSDVDRLVSQRRDIEDIYPLSPIQTLFYSANPLPFHTAFDQWHCTLRGALDVSTFQRAWHETLRRHTILRSTIHGDGLREPVQVVHRDFQLPWIVEDWRSFTPDRSAERWSAFLKNDRAQPLVLTDVPAMRFALIRLADATWKFLWSVPAMFMDGWSWPVVFHDASHLYAAHAHNDHLQLEPVRPYRDYIEWMANQSKREANEFWKKYLAGFHEPTQLLSEASDSGSDDRRYRDYVVPVSAATTDNLQNVARRLQITLNTIVQGAWALLLSHQSSTLDIVFGAAYSGRPSDLHGVESIVGPFVNNLPVRVAVDNEKTMSDYLRHLHAQLLELSPFQFTPLMEIQQCSEVPWRYRLFDSLIVFQNYLVDESARNFGGKIDIAEFTGPIHTNYPLMLLVEPGVTLRLKMIFDAQIVAGSTVGGWGRDFAMLLEQLPVILDKNVAELRGLFSSSVNAGRRTRRKLSAESLNYVPPQTEMEQAIAGVWKRMFGLEQVSIEENFFDLGGHSLLLVQMYGQLRETLNLDFSLLILFEYPTIRSLAGYLGRSAGDAQKGNKDLRDRAKRQREALAQFRKGTKNQVI